MWFFFLVRKSGPLYLWVKNMRPAGFADPFEGRPGIFHLASDHLETLRLFTDGESFCYGVNTLALGVARNGVTLFAMS